MWRYVSSIPAANAKGYRYLFTDTNGLQISVYPGWRGLKTPADAEEWLRQFVHVTDDSPLQKG